jgi:ABC-type glutathione transport system ATPase component
VPQDSVILEACGLTTVLGGKRAFLHRFAPGIRAVDDVSISIRRGETFGIVGESGCGKTTLARTLLGLVQETAGEIWLEGKRVDGLTPRRARRERRSIQYLHQDAAGSLDPWWSVGRTIVEASEIARVSTGEEDRVDSMLRAVGLDPSTRRLYPHQLSGGQLRRIAIARVLVLSPRILILDEPTAGLDLSVQASVLNLFREIKQRFQLTSLFISHDISIVRLMCDRVAVMHGGRIVEQAETSDLFRAPCHPYTRALMEATPRLVQRARALPQGAAGAN